MLFVFYLLLILSDVVSLVGGLIFRKINIARGNFKIYSLYLLNKNWKLR